MRETITLVKEKHFYGLIQLKFLSHSRKAQSVGGEEHELGVGSSAPRSHSGTRLMVALSRATRASKVALDTHISQKMGEKSEKEVLMD